MVGNATGRVQIRVYAKEIAVSRTQKRSNSTSNKVFRTISRIFSETKRNVQVRCLKFSFSYIFSNEIPYQRFRGIPQDHQTVFVGRSSLRRKTLQGLLRFPETLGKGYAPSKGRQDLERLLEKEQKKLKEIHSMLASNLLCR